MSDDKLRDELKAPVEPLLPIEKKLIGWSLGLGVALLIVLGVINRFLLAPDVENRGSVMAGRPAIHVGVRAAGPK